MPEPIKNRYDFILFFDVKNGNPNGDPDAGNLPRIDPETSHGIVSDVCLKRKVRNYVDLVRGEKVDEPDTPDGELGYKIYVQEGAVLNNRNDKAYVHYDMKPTSKKLPKKVEDQVRITKFMTDNFYDIRAFGAVMTTEVNCGQVRGPVQMCFAESIDPIVPLEMSITRMAATKEQENKDNKTMGRKQYVEDLELFFEALMNMFENDRSSARGLMSSRELIVFKHESKLGSAPASSLFDAVTVSRTIPDGKAARSFKDYSIGIDESIIPASVEMKRINYISPTA